MQRSALGQTGEPVEPLETPLDLRDHLGPYRVGPSDELTITLTGADGSQLFAPLAVRVNRHGEIALPAAGAVQVGDLELEDVEARIRQAYVPRVYREAVCHVTLTVADGTNVLVLGAVTTPGLVPLRRTERNLLFAIAAAGGMAESASGQATLRRLRRPGEELTLNLRNPAELRAAIALDPLEHGDIVQVHAARPNTVFVGGLVNGGSPQSYPSGAEMTVLQALAAAGGLRTELYPSEGTLIRRMPNGKDAHVKLDLKRMATGEDPNILLAAGDILWVPETWGTRVIDFFNRNFFIRGGATFNYSVSGAEFFNRGGRQSALRGGNLQDSFDPFGFLNRNSALQTLSSP